MSNTLDLRGPDFLLLYLGLFAAGLVAVWFFRRGARQAGGATSATPALDLYELAYLADGRRRALQTAVVSLCQRGLVSMNAKGALEARPGLAPAGGLEAAVYSAARTGSCKPGEVRTHCRSSLDSLADRLRGAGLIVPGGASLMARLSGFGVLLVVALFGVVKIGIGIDRNRPVAFLVILVAATAIAALVALCKSFHRTYAGDALLAAHSRRHDDLRGVPAARTGDGLIVGVALFGTTMLAGTAMADLQSPLDQASIGAASYGGGGSSCGSSCGGGSCGGGGCGGCGS